MGKFMEAKFYSRCKQTGKEIKKGEHIYYTPGIGSFCSDSKVYQEHKANSSDADMIQANEDAYFDDFCSNNNI